LGGAGSSDCSLRNPAALPYVSNVAVPGVTSFGIRDNFSPFGGTNQLTQFILGGRTQVKAMMDAQPTFVSVWIGNNDVLGSLTNSSNPGNPALATPQAAFEANYGPILDSIEKVGAKAVLIGVADVALIPYASSGATYWCIKNQPACGFTTPTPFPGTFQVALNCAPTAGDSVLVPWVVGMPKLAAAAAGASTALDCSVDNEVVVPSEYKVLRDAVKGYNAYISAQAQQRGWAYVDINQLAAYKADPTKIATFPTLPTGPSQPNVLFGSYFSLDGVHPSAAFHRVFADSIISAVNRTYETSIPFAGP